MKNGWKAHNTRGAIDSRLNSPKVQKKCSVSFFTLQNSFTIKSLKAFSVAEAMIALLIGTIALGMSAPMITKTMKNSDFSSLQVSLLGKKVNALENIHAGTRLNTLEGYNAGNRLTNLEGINAGSRLTALESSLRDVIGDIENMGADIDTALDASDSISSLADRISTLEKQNTNNEKIAELEKKVQSLEKFENFPSGSLVFTFGACPNTTYWQDVTSSYTNAFIKASTTSIGTVQNPSGNIPEHYHFIGIFTKQYNNDINIIQRGITTKYAYTLRDVDGDSSGHYTVSSAAGYKTYGVTTGQELIYPSNAAKNSTYQPKNVAVRVCKKKWCLGKL